MDILRELWVQVAALGAFLVWLAWFFAGDVIKEWAKPWVAHLWWRLTRHVPSPPTAPGASPAPTPASRPRRPAHVDSPAEAAARRFVEAVVEGLLWRWAWLPGPLVEPLVQRIEHLAAFCPECGRRLVPERRSERVWIPISGDYRTGFRYEYRTEFRCEAGHPGRTLDGNGVQEVERRVAREVERLAREVMRAEKEHEV